MLTWDLVQAFYHIQDLAFFTIVSYFLPMVTFTVNPRP